MAVGGRLVGIDVSVGVGLGSAVSVGFGVKAVVDLGVGIEVEIVGLGSIEEIGFTSQAVNTVPKTAATNARPMSSGRLPKNLSLELLTRGSLPDH